MSTVDTKHTSIAEEHTTYQTLTAANFHSVVLENPQPVLVDFWADWCKPCHAMAPVIEELARDFAGYATVGKLNVDEFPALAQKYGIRSIPTVLVFKDGEVVDQNGSGSQARIG